MQDIDLSDENGEPMEWTPIAQNRSSSRRLEGIFDGGGHTISGYQMTLTGGEGSSVQLGFFYAMITGGVVKNLTVDGDIVVKDYNVASNAVLVGGIVGSLNSGAIENCTNAGDIYISVIADGSRNISVGGIVGSLGTNFIVSNCINTGNITSTCTGDAEVNQTGGIVGKVPSSNTDGILNCTNNGVIMAKGGAEEVYAGGIVGYATEGNIIGCTNTADVASSNDWNDRYASRVYAGGIIGCDSQSYSEGEIANCVNKGNITAHGDGEGIAALAGGIGGGINGAPVSNSINSGSVSCDGTFNSTYAGGIAGWTHSRYNDDDARTSLVGCVNTGIVINTATGSKVAKGGITGYVPYENVTIENCTWAEGTADSGIGSNLASITEPQSKPAAQITSQAVATLAFESSELTLKNGATSTMKIQTLPAASANFAEHAKITNVTVEPEGIATATYNADGTLSITANALGTATLTVTAELYAMNYEDMTIDTSAPSTLTLTARVTVSDRSSEGLSLSPATLTLEAGKEGTLTASLLPEGTADKIASVTWSSDNEAVATVTSSEGVSCTVAAHAAGSATITAAAVTTDGYSYEESCTVTVSEAGTPDPEPVPDDPTPDTPHHGGGGGGCSAGFGAMALLALAPLAAMRRKK